MGPGRSPEGIEWHKLEDIYLYALLDVELGCSEVGIWGIVRQGNIPVDGTKTRHELLNECPGQRWIYCWGFNPTGLTISMFWITLLRVILKC